MVYSNTDWVDPRSKRDQAVHAMEDMKRERQMVDGDNAEISTFLLPRNSRFLPSDRHRSRRNNIYDNSATKALRVMGAGLMGGATNPSRPWFRLATPDRKLTESAAVKVWLNEVRRLMLDIFARSNTYRTLHSMYEELGAFGTSASFVVGDFQNIIHHHQQTFGEFSIALDERQMVNQIAREYETTVINLVRNFGYANCSYHVRNAYDRGDYLNYVPVSHLISPNAERDRTKRDNRNMAFQSQYFEPGAREADRDKFLRQSGFRRFPALAPRWQVTSTDVYASAYPGLETLGDIKQLQHENIRKGEGIDYQTKPPLQVPTKLKGRALDRLPGGITYYDSNQPNGGVRTLFEARLDLSHLMEDIRDVRDRIRQSFYVDMFLMLAADRSQKTATEVAELHEEKLLMLGPVLERLHNELLDPLIDITFDRILAARGPNGEPLLPPPPPELENVELRVEYISMLAQAQKAADTATIDRFTFALGNVALIKPDVLDKFNADAWADIYAEHLGVDPELITPGQQVAIVRKDRAAAQQQAMQMQMANAGADTAQKLSSAKTGESNALTQLTQGR